MMPQPRETVLRAAALVIASGLAAPAVAQDSVAGTPDSGGDALSAYDTARQTTRYAVDLVPITTSWGNTWAVAPVLKATRDADVLFNTLALGVTSVSPDVEGSVALGGAERSFSVWSGPGFGIAPENNAASTVDVPSLDQRFGVVFGDLNSDATNAVGALIGFNDDEPNRAWVRRTNAAHSRTFEFLSDTSSVIPSAIDAAGLVHLRVDGFNTSVSSTVLGDNIVTVDLPARSASSLNGISKGSGSSNQAFDGSATDFAINNSDTLLNPPAALPSSAASGGAGQPLVLDFASQYGVGGGAATGAHLNIIATSHRGNPTFTLANPLGGVGTVASLTRTNFDDTRTDAFNVFAVDASGAPLASEPAVLPVPMPDDASLNASSEAEFLAYDNQTVFRGPIGHVGLGSDGVGGPLVAAATATDPVAGEFIAVARFDSSVQWSTAAKIGQAVLDGPGGSSVGTLAAGAPVSLSIPAVDLEGNVYFVGLVDDGQGGDPAPSLIRAVNAPGGYELELLLSEGQAVLGANSDVEWTVSRIVLGDSDSVASAGFHGASVLQPQSRPASDAGDPFAVGGVTLSAQITYARGAGEQYEAVLLLRPVEGDVANLCAADFDGNGIVDGADFGTFGAAFGSSSGDANYLPDADFDNNGTIDGADFGAFGGEFGRDDCAG